MRKSLKVIPGKRRIHAYIHGKAGERKLPNKILYFLYSSKTLSNSIWYEIYLIQLIELPWRYTYQTW